MGGDYDAWPEKRGIISNGDAWIAAAARRYDLPLATHNGAHFHNIPSLRLICHAPDFRQ